jgi:hypothetical protein
MRVLDALGVSRKGSGFGAKAALQRSLIGHNVQLTAGVTINWICYQLCSGCPNVVCGFDILLRAIPPR